jgi:23S rRNA (guanosine2251-2'-O)-methyltransferase
MRNLGPRIEIQSLSAIEHILTHRPERVLSLSCQSSAHRLSVRVESILALAKEVGLSVGSHSKKEPQGEPLIAYLKPFEYADWASWVEQLNTQKKAVILALDHLQDPQNLGALCRTAEALGVQGVLIPKDRSVMVTPGAYHASVGAVETLPILQVTNLNEALRKLKEEEFWIVGAALGEGSKPLQETPSFDKTVLVLGTEWEGLKPTTIATCDWLVEIPLQGKVQSLNVSAAGAILIYEFSRRLQK